MRPLVPLPRRLWLAGVIAIASSVLAVASRTTGVTVPATSVAVLVFMVAAGTAFAVATSWVGHGWIRLRQSIALVGMAATALPGLWGLAVIASETAPDTVGSWAWAVLATTAHLPLLASFSLLPLLAVRYLGGGASRAPAFLVLMTGAATWLSFAAFFDEFAPLRAEPLVESHIGVIVGMSLNLVLVASVVLGPALASWAAWRTDGAAGRRLSFVAGSALTGSVLVMGCGALGAVGGGATVVLCGMYAALAVLVLGVTRALTAALSPTPSEASHKGDEPSGPRPLASPQAEEGGAPTLTARESEVLSLLALGLSNAGIAARLVVSERTVDAHLRSVFAKLDLPDGPEQNRRVHASLAWRGQLGERADAG
jgi:DNA-binding CsgD family transcriptional regulator